MSSSFTICSRRKETLIVRLPSICMDKADKDDNTNIDPTFSQVKSLGIYEMNGPVTPPISPILREMASPILSLANSEIVSPPPPLLAEPKYQLYSPVKYELPEVKRPRAVQHKSNYVSVGGAKLVHLPESEIDIKSRSRLETFDMHTAFAEPKCFTHFGPKTTKRRHVDECQSKKSQQLSFCRPDMKLCTLGGTFDDIYATKIRQKRNIIRVQNLIPLA